VARVLGRIEPDAIHASSMPRALETAEIIAGKFPDLRIRRSRLLWECMPTPTPGARLTPEERKSIARHTRRAERVLTVFFGPCRRRDRTEIIVSHGNLIRYLVARTLGARPQAWLNMDTHNASITKITVFGGGHRFLVSFNEVEHIPPSLRT
jgi:serine/threonine-protein phosphatase PGAM5